MKLRWKKMLISFITVFGLLGNTLLVSAEEQGDNYSDVEVEEIIIDYNESLPTSETKDFVNFDQELYIGQNFDINIMPLADEMNTDPNNARIISVNSIVSDVISEEKQQRWYAFAANEGKLTLNLNFEDSSNVDYDVYLFQYNDEEGTITLVDGMTTYSYVEHFARMVESGIYFVVVDGYSGYDASNPFTLGVVLSIYYDNQEVDDRLQDAYIFDSMDYSVTGTIDNQFDVDIQQYTVTKAGRLSILLSNNGSSKNIYAMELLDSYGNTLAKLNQNKKYTVDVPKGIFFFKVFCSSYGGDYSSTYTLSGDTRMKAAYVEVTHAGDAARPIQDYVDGPYWRVFANSYVEGIAYDSSGYILPNADIAIKITVVKNNQDIYAYGKTDSQGKFKIQLNIGDGVGQYMYNALGISWHYYDIVPVVFESNGAEISADVEYFYHFAYQIKI